MVMLCLVGCKAEGVSPEINSSDHKTQQEAGVEDPSKLEERSRDDRTESQECNAAPPQTGAGCDLEGIQAAVRAEISAEGGVGRCYRTHAADRGTGRLLMRIVLNPGGRAASVAISEDGLNNPGLADCIGGVLRDLQYPAPGDVPCTAIYPFNFQ